METFEIAWSNISFPFFTHMHLAFAKSGCVESDLAELYLERRRFRADVEAAEVGEITALAML